MKNLLKVAVVASVLSAAAYTNSAIASLTSLGQDDAGVLLIYDNVNNITWYDSVFIDTGTLLNVTKTLANTAGWTLPLIGRLTTLHTELGANPANWGPFETLPQYSTDSFVSSTSLSGKLERENLVTGFISTGTSSSSFGDGLYFHAGRVAVPEPSTCIAGALLLLPFGATTLRMLRRNRTA